jgi:hypothetical protein
MVRPSAPRLIAVAALATLACSDDSSTSDIPAECNPLDGTTCMLPWPSAAYEVADPSTPTGVRLALPAEAMPVNIDGIAVDPAPYNRFDGFPPSAPVIVVAANGFSGTGLPRTREPRGVAGCRLADRLWNMDTHERAPFFAEIDQNVADPTKRAL